MQLADELPMIYTVCIMAFATFSFRKPARTQALIAVGLVALAVFITVYYLYAKDPVFHQVAYGILTLSTVVRGFYVMERGLRPKLQQRNPADCDRHMREMYKLAVTAYHMILWRVWLNRCLDGSEKDFVLDWAPLRSVPQVVPRTRGSGSAERKKTQ
ncbi:alkaline ceramidase ydc1 [Collariella sp. IMI 366227]|nr:alkaline ceramidase ydc1 [Collariella sp. IMI 366227]